MSFLEKTKIALGGYRKETLAIQEAGVFRYRGRDLLKEHILPKKFRSHNIIQHYRDEFFSSQSSQIDFHRYFHHLNSSQALCVNLFFPLLAEGKTALILELLGISGGTVTKACFEKESDIEAGAGRKTNFDFYMQLAGRIRVYFEIKYTEAEFGKAKKDNEHKVKFAEIYQPLLKNNEFINPEFCGVDAFLDKYQIMRNLCHIDDNSYVVFVYPEANKKIHEQALLAQKNILTDKGRCQFKILLLETVGDEIMRNVTSAKLNDHYKEFKAKYFNLKLRI